MREMVFAPTCCSGVCSTTGALDPRREVSGLHAASPNAASSTAADVRNGGPPGWTVQRTTDNSSTIAAGRLNSWLDIRLRSEEHTSELQSLRHLVCRLLLEKKK